MRRSQTRLRRVNDMTVLYECDLRRTLLLFLFALCRTSLILTLPLCDIGAAHDRRYQDCNVRDRLAMMVQLIIVVPHSLIDVRLKSIAK